MRRKIWIVVMSMAVLAASTSSPAAAADGDGACFRDGEHVNPDRCETDCCSKSCNGCHVDGHYICGVI